MLLSTYEMKYRPQIPNGFLEALHLLQTLKLNQ